MTSEKKASRMKRKPHEPARLHWPDFPTREPLSSCQPGAACPSPGPSCLCFSDSVCFVFESLLLSLVLRLGTHCACFHGHWEALSAMCFKGNLSPPSTAAACPRLAHNECLLQARPLTQACQEEDLAFAKRGCTASQKYPSAECVDVYTLVTHESSCAPL